MLEVVNEGEPNKRSSCTWNGISSSSLWVYKQAMMFKAAHLAVMDALMSAHMRSIITIERVVDAVQ